MTAGLNPASVTEYIAFREGHAEASSDAGILSVTTLDETGVECGNAYFLDECRNAIANYDATLLMLGESCGEPPHPCQHYLVMAAGDYHGIFTGPKQIAHYLGPIDTPQEAMLLVHQGTFMGYWISCGTETGARAVSDGYEVLARQMVDACPVVDRVLLHVATDGTITELRRNVASVGSGCI
jgi:hypothetical protein